MEQVDVVKIIDDALALAADELSARGIDVDRSIQDPPPAMWADPDLMVQAVYELVVNAAEAADDNISIRIRVFADGDQVNLEVADSGPGIDTEKLHEISRPFFSTKGDHRGLGFLLLRKILRALDGQIEVAGGQGTGPQGKGACVRLRLPASTQQ